MKRLRTPRPAQPHPTTTTGLPSALRAGVEAISGYSMNEVKVHYNSAKPAQQQAHAYAKGAPLLVGPGQEPPEQGHVVVHAPGRVPTTRSGPSTTSANEEEELGQEADLGAAGPCRAGNQSLVPS